MGKRIVKYNPAFLTADELVESFVVRHAELDLIVQAIRENTGASNQHLLAIGPRGIGKTMLVLRAVEQVRRDNDLAERWYPLVFSEESYQVTTPGEFWLEAIFHLGQKTDDPNWIAAHDELLRETDETRLRERALAQLLDFADTQDKRLLLVVENFNMLLGEQISDDDGWALRQTLLHEPRIMLLATATSRFEQIDHAGKPMFELFRTIELEALNEDDCRKMWTSISGQEPADNRIRPIQILTGGSPRLLSIISTFGARMSFKELMSDLMQLVDDHTEYFKSHLDSLAPVERKAYVALVEMWDPASARDVAEAARLDVNKASSLLGRLKERGAVVEVHGKGRKKLYQVAERMYNIYYLMRRRGAPSRRVKAVVNFMVSFYCEQDLLRATRRMAEEACRLEPKQRKDHYLAYEQILRYGPTGGFREEIMQETPPEFLAGPDVPSSLRNIFGGARAAVTTDSYEQVAERFDTPEGTEPKVKVAQALFNKGVGLHQQKDYAGAVATYDELVTRFADTEEGEIKLAVAMALVNKGVALREQKDYAGAVATCDELVTRFADAEESEIKLVVAIALVNKGVDLREQKDYAGAVATYDELVTRFADAEESEIKLQVATALVNKGLALGEQKDYAGAAATYDELVTRFADAEEGEIKLQVAMALVNKVGALCAQKSQHAEVIAAWEKAEQTVTGYAQEASLRNTLAWTVYEHRFWPLLEKAETRAREAVALEPANANWRHTFASILYLSGKGTEALDEARKYLGDQKVAEATVENAIDLFVGLAAVGHAQGALDVLQDSPSAHLLEPLVVGLRLYLGEDVKAAAEISEVARDVVKRIEERRKELEAPRATQGQKEPAD